MHLKTTHAETLGTALILAGGKSERMGMPKGLLPYYGEPWIVHQLTQIRSCGITHAVIILGYESKHYFEKIPFFQFFHNQNEFSQEVGLHLSVLCNPLPELGPFSSITCGIQFLQARHTSPSKPPCSVFILPIDVPCPEKDVWESLRSHSENEVVIPVVKGKKGHPVLISSEFKNRLLSVNPSDEDARLDLQIKKIPLEKVCTIQVTDPKVQYNLNTPMEWKKFQKTQKPVHTV